MSSWSTVDSMDMVICNKYEKRERERESKYVFVVTEASFKDCCVYYL